MNYYSWAFDTSLAEHDKQFHPQGFDPETMSCEFRERRAKLDDADDLVEGGISGLFTGSSASYNRPSLIHVGTGEGSQVYGWGLYASNQRGVAEGYAFSESSKANPDRALKLNGRKIDWTYWEKNVKEDDYSSYKSIANLLAANGGNIDKVISDLELLIKNGWISRESVDWLKSNKSNVSYSGKSGNLYEQTFFTNRAPGDESHLLKWYEPVSDENLRRILDAIDKEAWRENIKYIMRSNINDLIKRKRGRANGNEVYATVAGALNMEPSNSGSKEQAASEFLARADIDGIKYPVDSYGGKTVKDGNEVGWNYVSFRDDNIRVNRKFVDGVEVPVKDSTEIAN